MAHLSKIISGVMTWGVWGRNLSTQEMLALMEQTYELGVNTFDHADIYGGYTTEEAFGSAFKKSSLKREKLIFISKCGIQYKCEKRPLKVKHYEYAKNYIISSVEKSLRFLKTDYLDIILLHRPSPLMNIEEIVIAISQLKKEGKILHFGVSNFTASQLDLVQKSISIEWNQIECSLTNNEAMFNSVLERMQYHKIKAMAWSPLGNYFKTKNEQNTRIKTALNDLCQKYNASESQLLIAWLLKHPASIYPVIGTTRIERIKEIIDVTKISLSTEDWFLLLEASAGHRAP